MDRKHDWVGKDRTNATARRAGAVRFREKKTSLACYSGGARRSRKAREETPLTREEFIVVNLGFLPEELFSPEQLEALERRGYQLNRSENPVEDAEVNR